MAAEFIPQWLTTAPANLTDSRTKEQKQRAKIKSLRSKAQRTRRNARKREAKLAKTLMEMDKQIGEVQANMRKLIEAEKQKSERFLSLARKYYGMWKRLTEKWQHKSARKSQSSQAKDFKPNVSFHFFFFQFWMYVKFVFKSLDG